MNLNVIVQVIFIHNRLVNTLKNCVFLKWNNQRKYFPFTHKKAHLHFIECSAPVVLDRWSFWAALGCAGDLNFLEVCIGLGEERMTLEDTPLVKAIWGTGVLTWLWTSWIEGTLCEIKRSIWERLHKTLLSVRAVLNSLKLWHLDIQIIINIPVLCSFCFSILQVYSFCFDLIFQHSLWSKHLTNSRVLKTASRKISHKILFQ